MVEPPNFQDRALYSRSLAPELKVIEKMVQEKADSTEEVKNEFKCSICLNLIFNPVECRECNGVFCDGCLQNWAKSNKDCPLCRKHINKGPLNRILKNYLD